MGNHAKLALIFAQTDPEKKHRGIGCFLVETEGQDGFQPQEIHGKMGLHALRHRGDRRSTTSSAPTRTSWARSARASRSR